MVVGKAWQCGGHGEAVLALCYVVCCVLLTPQDFDLVVFGCGVVLVWAIYIAPQSAALASFFLLASVVALFSFGSELAFLMGIAGLLLIEVLASCGSWLWVAVSGGIFLGWFCLGAPNHSWQMTPTIVPLIGLLAVMIAVLIGVLRRSAQGLRARRDAELKVIRLETRMEVAKQLHLGATDSLTRLIALAHDVSPELESQARTASLRLRELLESLTSHPNLAERSDLRAEIKEGIAVLQAANLKVRARLGRKMILVDPLIALVARELLTNALKYSAKEVRIELESGQKEGMLLVANDIKVLAGENQDNALSNGLGLERIYAMTMMAGGRIHSSEEYGVRSVVLEFPLYSDQGEL